MSSREFKHRRITLVSPDNYYTVQFTIEAETQCVVGRSDEKMAFYPLVDLTDSGAYGMGVSRMHAVLELLDNTLYITDHSSNGTQVNGTQVQKGQKFPLENHSIVSFGDLNFHVVIQSASSRGQNE